LNSWKNKVMFRIEDKVRKGCGVKRSSPIKLE
jgi:hypothetical protein